MGLAKAGRITVDIGDVMPVLTDNISTEERIDPTHDESLRNDHRHVPLHHSHHGFHPRRVRHGIGRWLASVLGIFEESA